LSRAGVANQKARRPIYALAEGDEPVVVRGAGATLALHPAADAQLRVSYRLDYGFGAPLMPQTHTAFACPATFTYDLARCRTFLTEAEAAGLRAMGIGRHLTHADLLVFGRRGPIDNTQR